MYISHKIEAVRKALFELNKTAKPEEKAFYDSLYDLVSSMAGEVDVITSRLEELEEKTENYETYTEHLSASLQSLRDCIVGDVTVDTDAYTAEYDEKNEEDCDCGCEEDEDCCCEGEEEHGDDCCCDHHPYEEEDDFEDFYSVQCPFCQQVFFVEKGDYKDNVNCPLCNHSVAVLDNLLD